MYEVTRWEGTAPPFFVRAGCLFAFIQTHAKATRVVCDSTDVQRYHTVCESRGNLIYPFPVLGAI
jgi:hypothetical protein